MSQLIFSLFDPVELKTRTQPARRVRNKDLKPPFLREIASRTPGREELTREKSFHVTEQRLQVAPDPGFKPCKMSVTLGASANLSKAERDHVEKLGQWHHRRQRRRERLRR